MARRWAHRITLYSNTQWQVTRDGMNSLRCDCPIPAHRLLELRLGGGYYDWPLHMAEKPGVDIELFLEMWLKAIQEHEPQSDDGFELDEAMLDRSLDMARRLNRKAVSHA